MAQAAGLTMHPVKRGTNKSAAARGLKSGLITKAQYEQILQSAQRFQCPPFNAITTR